MREPTILVFCGPPCAGKSRLSKELEHQSKFAIFPRFEMDELRLVLTPKSHTAEDRSKAYGRMHELAATCLRFGAPGVILDATYQQRRAVNILAQEFCARLLIFECAVGPDKAVERFEARLEGHAGIDLSAERVWDLAHEYPYFDNTIRLDTSSPIDELIPIIISAASTDTSFDIAAWIACGNTSSPKKASSSDALGRDVIKLTEKSRKRASWLLIPLRLALPATVVAAGLALAVCLKAGLDQYLPSLEKYNLIGEPAEWVVVWLAMTGLGAAFAGTWDRFVSHPETKKLVGIIEAGTIPRLPLEEMPPTNRELYRRYKRRLEAADDAEMREAAAEQRQPRPEQAPRMLIPDLPLWFLIEPQSQGFDVVVTRAEECAIEHSLLQERAALLGLDWYGYLKWREKEVSSQYFWRSQHKTGLRVLQLRQTQRNDGSVMFELAGCPGRFMSYVCTELSANFRLPGRWGFDVRQVLEGPAWRKWDKNFKNLQLRLDDVAQASKTHEMLVGVQVGLTTSDGFLLLHRRSDIVQSAVGGAASSGAGGAKWTDFDFGKGKISLVESAIREVGEEIGWEPAGRDELTSPFLGAAYSLLRGRDLNFYCHFHTERSLTEISENLYRQSWWRYRAFMWPPSKQKCDAWEVAHLIPVPVESVHLDGTLDDRFQCLVSDARHVRGLLKCLAQSEKFKKIRSDWVDRRLASSKFQIR